MGKEFSKLLYIGEDRDRVLYLGDISFCARREALEEMRVGAVCSVIPQIPSELPSVLASCGIHHTDHLLYPLDDSWDAGSSLLRPSIGRTIVEVCLWIRSRLARTSVLVHCDQGLCRSASVCIAYMMLFGIDASQPFLTFAQAQRLVMSLRHGIAVRHFKDDLKLLETMFPTGYNRSHIPMTPFPPPPSFAAALAAPWARLGVSALLGDALGGDAWQPCIPSPFEWWTPPFTAESSSVSTAPCARSPALRSCALPSPLPIPPPTNRASTTAGTPRVPASVCDTRPSSIADGSLRGPDGSDDDVGDDDAPPRLLRTLSVVRPGVALADLNCSSTASWGDTPLAHPLHELDAASVAFAAVGGAYMRELTHAFDGLPVARRLQCRAPAVHTAAVGAFIFAITAGPLGQALRKGGVLDGGDASGPSLTPVDSEALAAPLAAAERVVPALTSLIAHLGLSPEHVRDALLCVPAALDAALCDAYVMRNCDDTTACFAVGHAASAPSTTPSPAVQDQQPHFDDGSTCRPHGHGHGTQRPHARRAFHGHPVVHRPVMCPLERAAWQRWVDLWTRLLPAAPRDGGHDSAPKGATRVTSTARLAPLAVSNSVPASCGASASFPRQPLPDVTPSTRPASRSSLALRRGFSDASHPLALAPVSPSPSSAPSSSGHDDGCVRCDASGDGCSCGCVYTSLVLGYLTAVPVLANIFVGHAAARRAAATPVVGGIGGARESLPSAAREPFFQCAEAELGTSQSSEKSGSASPAVRVGKGGVVAVDPLPPVVGPRSITAHQGDPSSPTLLPLARPRSSVSPPLLEDKRTVPMCTPTRVQPSGASSSSASLFKPKPVKLNPLADPTIYS